MEWPIAKNVSANSKIIYPALTKSCV